MPSLTNYNNYEREVLDNYRQALIKLVRESEKQYDHKQRALYEKYFNKVFNVKNILTFRNLKIPQIKSMVDKRIKEDNIDINSL